MLFFINEKGQPGGHMFSLENTVSALSKSIETGVYVLGSPFVGTSELKCYLGSAPLSSDSYKTVKEVIKRFSPDVIHCFDITSYVFVSLFFSKNYRILLTKCGGPNPRTGRFIPCSPYMVLYSRENLKYFTRKKKYSRTKFSFLPNRVCIEALKSDSPYIYNDKCFNICQIIRIDPTKEKNIHSSLNLIGHLNSQVQNVHFTLVGTVNSQESYNRICDYINNNSLSEVVTLITDGRTARGSSFLPGADCVIATGRSLMEACSLGKRVLCPVADLDIPVLLRSDNFQLLFDTNFSGRANSSAVCDKELEIIVRTLNDTKFRESISEYTKEQADKYFIITDSIVGKYKEIYGSMKLVNYFYMLVKNLHIYLYYIWLWTGRK